MTNRKMMSATANKSTINEELNQKLLAAAELLDQNGIGLTIEYICRITPSQMMVYFTDPDSLHAELEGVSKDVYLQCKAFIENGCMCGAKTKKGNPCGNPSLWTDGCARHFTPGVSDRCWLHGGPKRVGDTESRRRQEAPRDA